MKTVYYPTVHRFSSPTVSGSVCQPDVSFSISYMRQYMLGLQDLTSMPTSFTHDHLITRKLAALSCYIDISYYMTGVIYQQPGCCQL